jgi:dipeptide/tripeptide permease
MLGIITGVLLASTLTLAGFGKIWGWHAGVICLAVNVTVGIVVSYLFPTRVAEARSNETTEQMKFN